MALQKRTEADYDAMSWHDASVYAFEIREGEYGTGEVTLHLDYILEWLPAVDGAYSFRVAPAVLTFRSVSGLQLELDYRSVSAGLTPFTIGQISREVVNDSTDFRSYQWNISINWPEGHITFDAPAYEQEFVGSALVTSEQCLTPDERARCRASFDEARVRINGSAITDWEAFHTISASVFGFPELYGRNMNAWIDCLTYVRQGDGMSRFRLGPQRQLVIEVQDSSTMRSQASDMFGALVDAVAAVNQRQIELGEEPALLFLMR
jgi:hypothetical protein